MPSIGLIPALSLVAGAVCGVHVDAAFIGVRAALPAFCVFAVAAWFRRWPRATLACLVATFWCGGAALAAHARDAALHPSLRLLLDREIGGFALESLGPEADHDPILTRAILTEDASPRETYVALGARVTGIVLHGTWREVDGQVSLSVNGAAAFSRTAQWRAGRTIEAPLTFRRPTRYLNDGVPDFERALALDGITLLASAKSGLLVDVTERAGTIGELAADVRAHVRHAVATWVAPHDPTSAAIVTAVLIGDRTGLPTDVRDALQAAGTYHVIAISGGNIAILAGCIAGVLLLVGIRGRLAAAVAFAIVLAYAMVVTAGPSVWRATLVALLYLFGRTIDHRTPAWHAASVAAAAILVAHPLDIRDPGFILTFGATMALLHVARRGRELFARRRFIAWVVAPMVASAAIEAMLLPASATMFSRVTTAGVVLNLAAVPLMAIVQISGLVVAAADAVPSVASTTGWIAHASAFALVRTSQLVTFTPWVTARVPPPSLIIVIVYYAALTIAIVIRNRRVRRASVTVAVVSALVIAGVVDPHRFGNGATTQQLRLTVFDVGQGESMLAEMPDGYTMLIDSGGTPFGGGTFDVGARVLAPALWTRGLRSLDALLVTHGDPDHIGGAPAVVRDFKPAELWEGIRVPSHTPTNDLLRVAAERRVRIRTRRAGEELHIGGVRLRVLHPQEPDWERQRVRNDDSVVVELLYGDVAMLMTGDIGADVEREILPRLTRARTRILKVAHHGSRTSSSQALLDAWRPQIAVISCGRGNTFGHPAPDVMRRLESIGARVFRTDLDGQISLSTDGRDVTVRTLVGGRR